MRAETRGPATRRVPALHVAALLMLALALGACDKTPSKSPAPTVTGAR